MTRTKAYDAVIVGSGPNGLAAAITLARHGQRVLVIEGAGTIGGGTRTEQLTLPGFLHDVCSATHPLAAASPFFRWLPLSKFGLEWVHPHIPLAHPLDDGTAVILERSLDAAAYTLRQDARAYHKLMRPWVGNWRTVVSDFLAPLPSPFKHPLLGLRLGLKGLQSAWRLAQRYFKGEQARALLAGLAAHANLPLERPLTAVFGLILGTLAHAVGWPFARGGSQSITQALAAYLISSGGEIITGWFVDDLPSLPPAKAVLLDITPRQALHLLGQRLPAGYRRQLEGYRYGPGVFKMDFALDGPVPWKAAECAHAGTLHLGGSLEEIAWAERAVWRGEHPQRPFVIVAQPSLFDPNRAPNGKHTLWAYCHVPHGSNQDMSEAIEAQIERFAPGFQERILARHSMSARDLERYNPNHVGGDIGGGVLDLRQLFTRPTPRWNPYTTPIKGVYLCSSATPPGPGVHGLCGYYAARAVLKG